MRTLSKLDAIYSSQSSFTHVPHLDTQCQKEIGVEHPMNRGKWGFVWRKNISRCISDNYDVGYINMMSDTFFFFGRPSLEFGSLVRAFTTSFDVLTQNDAKLYTRPPRLDSMPLFC